MTLLLDNRTGEPVDESLFELVARAALAYEQVEYPCEVSVSLVDDDEIWELNRRFRHVDRPTDVLSFPQEDETENEAGERLLGDIIISLERAKAQAAEYGHSLRRELAFLTAHSMLHLLGYDHREPEEEKDMFARQEAILQQAGIPRV